jgi:hypothetical protein
MPHPSHPHRSNTGQRVQTMQLLTVAISKQLIFTSLLISETSGENLSVIDSTHFINKGILCARNNDVHHISEDFLNSRYAQVKTYLAVHSFDCEDGGTGVHEHL